MRNSEKLKIMRENLRSDGEILEIFEKCYRDTFLKNLFFHRSSKSSRKSEELSEKFRGIFENICISTFTPVKIFSELLRNLLRFIHFTILRGILKV